MTFARSCFPRGKKIPFCDLLTSSWPHRRYGDMKVFPSNTMCRCSLYQGDHRLTYQCENHVHHTDLFKPDMIMDEWVLVKKKLHARKYPEKSREEKVLDLTNFYHENHPDLSFSEAEIFVRRWIKSHDDYNAMMDGERKKRAKERSWHRSYQKLTGGCI